MATAMQILSGPKHLQKTMVEEPAGQGSAASRRWGRWTCEAPLFANVAEQDHKNESMSWARWGAVKWVQNQPRALAANAYEAGVDEGESFIPVLKFETFWEMVRPCLCKEATKADVDAILKRATFLVNTKQFVYYLSFCSAATHHLGRVINSTCRLLCSNHCNMAVCLQAGSQLLKHRFWGG